MSNLNLNQFEQDVLNEKLEQAAALIESQSKAISSLEEQVKRLTVERDKFEGGNELKQKLISNLEAEIEARDKKIAEVAKGNTFSFSPPSPKTDKEYEDEIRNIKSCTGENISLCYLTEQGEEAVRIEDYIILLRQFDIMQTKYNKKCNSISTL